MSIPNYNHHHMTSMPFIAGGIIPTAVGVEGQTIEGQQAPYEYNLLNLKKRRRKLYTKMNIGDEDEYEDNEEQNEAVYANMINNGRNRNGRRMREDKDEEDEEDEEEDESDDEDDSDEEEEDEEDDEDLIFEEAQEEMQQQWHQVDKTATMIPMRDRKIIQACTINKFIGNGNQVVVTHGKCNVDEKFITRSLSAHT